MSRDEQLLTWNPQRPQVRARVIEEVLLHEMGHVMGLDHVDDRSQVMNPVSYGDLLTYQAGDLNGLRLVGRGAGPCRALDPPQLGPDGSQRRAATRTRTVVG